MNIEKPMSRSLGLSVARAIVYAVERFLTGQASFEKTGKVMAYLDTIIYRRSGEEWPQRLYRQYRRLQEIESGEGVGWLQVMADVAHLCGIQRPFRRLQELSPVPGPAIVFFFHRGEDEARVVGELAILHKRWVHCERFTLEPGIDAHLYF